MPAIGIKDLSCTGTDWTYLSGKIYLFNSLASWMLVGRGSLLVSGRATHKIPDMKPTIENTMKGNPGFCFLPWISINDKQTRSMS